MNLVPEDAYCHTYSPYFQEVVVGEGFWLGWRSLNTTNGEVSSTQPYPIRLASVMIWIVLPWRTLDFSCPPLQSNLNFLLINTSRSHFSVVWFGWGRRLHWSNHKIAIVYDTVPMALIWLMVLTDLSQMTVSDVHCILKSERSEKRSETYLVEDERIWFKKSPSPGGFSSIHCSADTCWIFLVWRLNTEVGLISRSVVLSVFSPGWSSKVVLWYKRTEIHLFMVSIPLCLRREWPSLFSEESHTDFLQSVISYKSLLGQVGQH